MQRTIQKVVAVSHLEPIRAVIASGINDDGTHVREARLDNASLSKSYVEGSAQFIGACTGQTVSKKSPEISGSG
jgi:broad specificity phosphatase PhoE